MEAKIAFDVYKDFSEFLDLECEYDSAYDEPLKELNTMLKDLVAEDKLVFTYKGKRVKIHLPLTIHDVGNIFAESLGDNETLWNDVSVPCKLRCKTLNFDSSELRVEKCPYWLDPTHIYY